LTKCPSNPNVQDTGSAAFFKGQNEIRNSTLLGPLVTPASSPGRTQHIKGKRKHVPVQNMKEFMGTISR
jgi:hypothetical protein